MAEGEVGAVAPVETPVAAPIATTQPDSTADQAQTPETPEPEAKPERTFTQKELDDIVAKRAAQAERRALKIAREARADEREFQQRSEPQRQQQQPQGMPREEDFAGRPYRDYVEALTDWKFEQRMTKERETSQQQATAQREQRQAAENARYVHENIIAKGLAKHADFIDVVTEVDGITEAMVASAADLSNGADVLYHLSGDDTERLRIAALRPAQQAFALKDLSAKLAAPPKPTQTPAPIRPTGGPASPVKSLSDLIGGSQEDFERRRKAHLARK